MSKRDDHIRSLALELSYACTAAGPEQWWRLWLALQDADRALADEIEEAWKRYKPCFYEWVCANPDEDVDTTTCVECRGGVCGEEYGVVA